MPHIVTVPMLQNGKPTTNKFFTDTAEFNPMQADPSSGPEVAQGVFRNVSCDFGTWDASAVALMLGYLGNIWSKVQHPGYPDQVAIPVVGATGEGFFDLAEHAATFPNFQVSRVTFNVTSYPAGSDLVFGQDPLIKGGVVSFFVSNEAKFGQDWLPVAPIKVDPAFTLQLAAGATVGGAMQQSPPLSGVLNIPGVYPGTFIQESIPLYTPESTAAVTVAGQIVFGGQPKQPKPPLVLSGGVENAVRDFFPLQWINHLRSTFVPPTPNTNGIWWQLNTGVVADIQIFGTTRDPGVEVTMQTTGPVN